ncbi:putative integral membrane protein [Colletotrichum sublineola]|uniref:Putative integral membrane protein n=1 Tax=Colletotrichum sublineola TaxID=1173701 RepID=A0A066X5L3_COLSU|nr:putative integral membrane protein [Colletotrichum sublineola]
MDPAALAGLTIYNLPPMPPKWDSIGIFYITFCATWTVIVFAGMAFLWANRKHPILKIRGLPLAFSSITFLHMYWCMAQITYPIGGTMPVVIAYDVQYFVMGICCKGFNSRTTGLTIDEDAMCLLTAGMWVACKKYHPTFGIPGTEIRGKTLPEQLIDLGRGWEWWPTIIWQFVWTWVVAPILIWRAWGIRDTMGWRTQTVGCCLSSLHATPMFLIASYVPAFEKINMYFTPSQWIHLSTMMFEIFTIFIPLVQLIRLRIQTKHVTDANAKWESGSRLTFRSSTVVSYYGNKNSPSPSQAEKGQPAIRNSESSALGPEPDSRLLTMTALDHALRENRNALQEFSALSDFSGENIAFLARVSEWKSQSWPHALSDSKSQESLDKDERLEAYNRALEIYADFISLQHAKFPLNLPSQEMKHLFNIFDKPARIMFGEDQSINTAIPFDDVYMQGGEGSRSGSSGDIRNPIRYTGEVPVEFDSTIFDLAYSDIKYLVLTNTWPKFVKEMHQRRRSGETGRSVVSNESESSLLSWISSGMTNLIRSVKAI